MIRFKKPTNAVSFSCSSVLPLTRRSEHRTGVTLSETTSEAMSDMRYAAPSDASNRPSTPGIKNTGRKTMATRTVAYTIEFLTSLDALNMTLVAGSFLSPALHSRKRRNTFSTSTMASSISSPIATANPPSVMTFTENPVKRNTIAVTRMLSGRAVSVMMVVRTFIRKRIRMITTRMVPSRRASITFFKPERMNHSCRNKSFFRSTFFGRPDLIDSSVRSTSADTCKVSASGCRMMRRMAPGFPSIVALPRTGLGPSITLAMSASRTGRPSIIPIASSRSCEISVGANRMRIGYSLPPCDKMPPLLLFNAVPTFISISSIRILYLRICSAFRLICHSRTSPPMTMTSATPGTRSSAGRIVQSASVRSCMPSMLGSSEVIPAHITSPIIDPTGPSTGFTFEGSRARVMRS